MSTEVAHLSDLFPAVSPPDQNAAPVPDEAPRKCFSPSRQKSGSPVHGNDTGAEPASQETSSLASHTSSSRHTPAHTPPRKLSGGEDISNAQGVQDPPKVQDQDQEIPIDPSLLDVSVDQHPKQLDQTPSKEIEERQDDFDPFATPVGAEFPLTSEQLLLPLQTPGPFDFSLDPSSNFQPNTDKTDTPQGPTKTPWSLNTKLNEQYTDSQPASTTFTDSPATPGLGAEGLYHGQPWADMSREGSMTDLESYVGVTKGLSTTAASSESGYEPMNKGEGVPPPRGKKSHARKQPEGHIKRARNAFILFRKHITDSNLIPPSVEVKHQNISVVAAKMWREAPQDVRQKFQEQARLEKEEHQRLYPGYRYQPVFRRTDIIRRRVRKDPAEDEKVEAVAEALIKGKSGGALEKDIKEQMVALTEEVNSSRESEGDMERRNSAPPPPPLSRRRRREVGQLSKGAIRAQRAQARAKQMRQNLIGSNLLSVSMYNAAQQRAAAAAAAAGGNNNVNHYGGYNIPPGGDIAGVGVGGMPSHPGAQHYQYTMGGEPYLPVGYDIDGQAVSYDPTGGMYDPNSMNGGMDSGEMYRLPPIGDLSQGHPGAYGDWQAPGGDYWGHDPNTYGGHGGDTMGMGDAAGEMGYYGHPGGMEGYDVNGGYQLPPLIDPSNSHGLQAHQAHLEHQDHQPHHVDYRQEYAHGEGYESNEPGPSGAGPSRNSVDHPWADAHGTSGEGQQTPSGHVMFNERLFDGALGSAGLGGLGDAGPSGLGLGGGGRDDGMSGFEEAMAQVNEISQW